MAAYEVMIYGVRGGSKSGLEGTAADSSSRLWETVILCRIAMLYVLQGVFDEISARWVC